MNSQLNHDANLTMKSPLHAKIEECKYFDLSQKENFLIKQDSSDTAAYKKKKTLKLLTNNTSEDDKMKLFTPQPQNAINDSTVLFLSSINCMSHPPSRKLKSQNSTEFHDFFHHVV